MCIGNYLGHTYGKNRCHRVRHILYSYDEPNCEENWADLLNKVPGQNVYTDFKGFDATRHVQNKAKQIDLSQ